MRVFRRRGAGATDGTAQDDPGAQSPDVFSPFLSFIYI